MLGIIMQYSLVELVVNGTAAQKIDNQLAKQSFPVLNWNKDGSSTTFAKNDNCVPHRLRDQPKKNETLRMWETTPARFPIGFLIFFPSLGFPTRIRIQIEFARPHVSNTYPDNLLPRTPLGILETEHASR